MSTSTKGRACVGKVRHASKAEAQAHVRRLIRRGAVRMTAYACRFCAGWHVGHLPKPRRTR